MKAITKEKRILKLLINKPSRFNFKNYLPFCRWLVKYLLLIKTKQSKYNTYNWSAIVIASPPLFAVQSSSHSKHTNITYHITSAPAAALSRLIHHSPSLMFCSNIAIPNLCYCVDVQESVSFYLLDKSYCQKVGRFRIKRVLIAD